MTSRILIFNFVILYFVFSTAPSSAEKVYVVEREREGVAVMEDGRFKGQIKGMGNLNHATIKFEGGSAYVISRDGFLSRIDTDTDRLIKKAKVGNSGIGFTFCMDFIAVANYDPKNVVLLDRGLNILKEIETDSRNVGIKCWNNLLAFSLMDRDEIWILDLKRGFGDIRVVKTGGEMPFDALISGNVYVAGFFKGGVGILDLKDLIYSERLLKAGGEVVFKVPHFGTWGILDHKAFIPAVGERKVHLVDLKNFDYSGHVDLIGLPVFVVVSPDRNHIAVNYSGDREDFITIIDPVNNKIVKHIEAGKRIMHLRFSDDGRTLYVSSYFENAVKIIDVNSWEVEEKVSVPTPSGIFIVPEKWN